jgi:hypothetical protein
MDRLTRGFNTKLWTEGNEENEGISTLFPLFASVENIFWPLVFFFAVDSVGPAWLSSCRRLCGTIL